MKKINIEKNCDMKQEEAKKFIKVDIVTQNDDEMCKHDIHQETSSIIFIMPKGDGMASGIIGAFSGKTLTGAYKAVKDLEKELYRQIESRLGGLLAKLLTTAIIEKDDVE